MPARDPTYESTIRSIPDRVSWWRLGETAGPGADDQQDVQDGTYKGGVTFDQPPLPADTSDRGIAFDGVDGHVEISPNAAHELAQGTALIWFNLDHLDRDQGLLSKDTNDRRGGETTLWYRQQENALKWLIGSPDHLIEVVGALTAGRTYCAVLVWGSGGMKLYLANDGIVRLCGTDPHTGGLSGNANPIYLGASGAAGPPAIFAEGRLGDVVIWKRALNDAEIEAATQATLPVEGSYEPTVMGLSPEVYLKFAETTDADLVDSSGKGRNGTIRGSGANLGISPLADNVGGTNTAIDLGDAAWVEVAHARKDVELTFPENAPWDRAGFRRIADCTVALYFRPNSLPGEGKIHPIVSKQGDTEFGFGEFSAWYDAKGAVHLEAHTNWRKASIRTPDGAVKDTGDVYHLTIQLAYDGLKAWLNGAAFEDGYGNLLHVNGLGADILGITHANTQPWRINRDGTGNLGDMQVDEFAVYLRELNEENAQALAQSGDVPPLAHYVWGKATKRVSGANASEINEAIKSLNASGGGTVLIAKGIYSGTVTLLSNVRIKKDGEGVVLLGAISTEPKRENALSDVGGDFGRGAITLDVRDPPPVANAIKPGAVIKIMGTPGDPSSPLRHDRKYNRTESESHDPKVPDGEALIIESSNASGVTFRQPCFHEEFTRANRNTVKAWTPHKLIAVEDIECSSDGGPNGGGTTFELNHAIWCRVVNVVATTTSATGRAMQFNGGCVECTVRGCKVNNHAAPTANNGGLYTINGCKSIVYADCHANRGRHGYDYGATPAGGPVTHVEWHRCKAANQIQRGVLGAHGNGSGIICWNCSTARGGIGASGWQIDARWLRCGLNAGFGDIIPTDGIGDCYFRDFDMNKPSQWFGWTDKSQPGCERCCFENIKHTALPTSNSKKLRFPLRTDDHANKFRKDTVDSPDGEWKQV
jgi:Concanavalin A-like lectin/glucanases superfamily